MNEDTTSKTVYFKSLTIEGINCFKSEQTIGLTDREENSAMWTVVLGNNNTGKTTLLRCLAAMEPLDIENKTIDKHETINLLKVFSINYFTEHVNSLYLKVKPTHQKKK